MKVQKFFKGDLVRIGKLSEYKSHYPQDCEMVVNEHCIGFGGDKNVDQYSMFFPKDIGYTLWYNEDDLTFIREDAYDLLPAYSYDRKVFEAKKSRRIRLDLRKEFGDHAVALFDLLENKDSGTVSVENPKSVLDGDWHNEIRN